MATLHLRVFWGARRYEGLGLSFNKTATLFSGSIRKNLDPWDEKTDAKLWAALEDVGLAAAVRALPQRLAHVVTAGGSNLSQGQGQLLCIARTLLKACKVVVLDEATSSVDPATDAQIQACVKREFQGRTVLTVAHRIESLLDSTKVVVLSRGKILESGPPAQLRADDASEFGAMLRKAEALRGQQQRQKQQQQSSDDA